ncbi:acyltransferase family protein [Rhodococcus fascians]|nr:acyltransferase family protein [Rhodococcus fascians]
MIESVFKVRMHWVDVARGVCVLLVVLHHVIRQLAAEAPDGWRSAVVLWESVDEVLTPIRIPLFFLMSGMLVAGRASAPWPSAKSKLVVPAYLYVVWSVLLAAREFVPVGEGMHGSGASKLGAVLAEIVLACSGYWYLFALPIYFVVARYSVWVNRYILVVVLLVPLLFRSRISGFFVDLSSNFTESPSLLGSICVNVGFFVAGVRFKSEVEKFAESSNVLWGVGLLATYIVAVSANVCLDLQILAILSSFAGILLGVCGARLVTSSISGNVLQYIGARTLPVYVLQFFYISILSLVWSLSGDRADRLSIVAGFAYPLLLVAVISAVSLLFFNLASRSRLRYLFQPPKFLL